MWWSLRTRKTPRCEKMAVSSSSDPSLKRKTRWDTARSFLMTWVRSPDATSLPSKVRKARKPWTDPSGNRTGTGSAGSLNVNSAVAKRKRASRAKLPERVRSAKGGAADTGPVLREFFQSAKGGAADTGPVLREFFQSAKGAVARRQAAKELLSSSGGAADTGPVLRELFQSAKGAVARRQAAKELLSSSGGAADTGPVLRKFFQSMLRI